jgi:hypothetical protein
MSNSKSTSTQITNEYIERSIESSEEENKTYLDLKWNYIKENDSYFYTVNCFCIQDKNEIINNKATQTDYSISFEEWINKRVEKHINNLFMSDDRSEKILRELLVSYYIDPIVNKCCFCKPDEIKDRKDNRFPLFWEDILNIINWTFINYPTTILFKVILLHHKEDNTKKFYMCINFKKKSNPKYLVVDIEDTIFLDSLKMHIKELFETIELIPPLIINWIEF